jgi:maltose alpha-D-glucosyltransferase/alpha-amylase
VEFPEIGVLPYMLTLAGHGFYWFELSRPAPEPLAPQPEPEPEVEQASDVADALVQSGLVADAEEATADPTGGDR